MCVLHGFFPGRFAYRHAACDDMQSSRSAPNNVRPWMVNAHIPLRLGADTEARTAFKLAPHHLYAEASRVGATSWGRALAGR